MESIIKYTFASCVWSFFLVEFHQKLVASKNQFEFQMLTDLPNVKHCHRKYVIPFLPY